MSDASEVTIQTRVPDALQQAIKLLALQHQVLLKEEAASALTLFLSKSPWLCGTWVKQPKSHEFRPITVKVPSLLGKQFEQQAEAMEVSTSSLAYTAFDWYINVAMHEALPGLSALSKQAA